MTAATVPPGTPSRRLHPGAYPVLVATHAGAEPADVLARGTTATMRFGDEP